jgi:DNA-binding MarR family transcriptional regulator
MPRPPGISDTVLRFIEECIDSVPQLETLLMMMDDPQRDWTAAEIAGRVYITREDAVRVLDALRRRGMIAPLEAGQAFRILLADEQRRALLEEVARSYRANLTRIATFIHEKPPASLKEFARAFTLKKDR